MSKASNLLAILWLLQARPSMTAAEIAERLELDVRTVYRYMDDLLTSGVPVIAESGPAGGYRLGAAFRGAPLHFTPDELAALAHAARLAQGLGHPDGQSLASALDKVEHTLTEEQESALARRRSAVALASEAQLPPVAAPLERAAAERLQVILRHERAGASTERCVDPYALFLRGARWYLVGFCHLRQELREFRLDRITSVTTTETRFEPLPGFNLSAYIGNSWIDERVQSEPTVLVRLAAPEYALDQLATHWYLSHCLVERREGEVDFRLDPIGLEHLPGYLLIFGPVLEIREPASLRLAVARLAAELAAHHERKDP